MATERSSDTCSASSTSVPCRLAVTRPCPMPSVIELPARSITCPPLFTKEYSTLGVCDGVGVRCVCVWRRGVRAGGASVAVGAPPAGGVGQEDADVTAALLQERAHARQRPARARRAREPVHLAPRLLPNLRSEGGRVGRGGRRGSRLPLPPAAPRRTPSSGSARRGWRRCRIDWSTRLGWGGGRASEGRDTVGCVGAS